MLQFNFTRLISQTSTQQNLNFREFNLSNKCLANLDSLMINTFTNMANTFYISYDTNLITTFDEVYNLFLFIQTSIYSTQNFDNFISILKKLAVDNSTNCQTPIGESVSPSKCVNLFSTSQLGLFLRSVFFNGLNFTVNQLVPKPKPTTGFFAFLGHLSDQEYLIEPTQVKIGFNNDELITEICNNPENRLYCQCVFVDESLKKLPIPNKCWLNFCSDKYSSLIKSTTLEESCPDNFCKIVNLSNIQGDLKSNVLCFPSFIPIEKFQTTTLYNYYKTSAKITKYTVLIFSVAIFIGLIFSFLHPSTKIKIKRKINIMLPNILK